MDSIVGLFNSSDIVHEPRKKQPQKSNHRRGAAARGKNAHLPDESSFLCEPDLDNEMLVKNSSYIDSFIEELTDDKAGKIIRRKGRNRRRRSRHMELNNLSENAKAGSSDVGKNVNDLRDNRRAKRRTEPFSPMQADGDFEGWCQGYEAIDRLEKVSVSDFGVDLAQEYYGGDDSASDDQDADESSDWESGSEVCGRLPPEPQLGNVEYKLKLVRPSEQRFQHLVTQLKWRMVSGGGTAVYVVGVDDDGAVRGLSPTSLRHSVRTLTRMARSIGATLQVTTRRTTGDKVLAEVVLRKMTQSQESVELRVAVMGANEAGKSTLVGVLTQGELDNGRGSARLNMFRHLHEVRSGRTSSLSHEILGFDAQGGVVNYGCSELMTAARIDAKSSKLIAFIDLAGHYKYQRTTVFGLALYRPHYAMLVVSATAGINRMTEEHLSLALALDLQFFVVVTKVELVSPDELDRLVAQIDALNSKLNCDKQLVLIEDEKAASELLSRPPAHGAQTSTKRCVGVFPVSCVKGLGLSCLHAALHAAMPHELACEPEPCEFQIDEIFCVGDNICPIVGGLQVKGSTNDGDTLLIGPLQTGDFVPITVKSLYRNRVPCSYVKSGQAASLGLSQHPPILRQGMVLIAKPKNYAPRVFEHKINCNHSRSLGGCKQNRKVKLLKKVNNKRKNRESDGECKNCDSSSDDKAAASDVNQNFDCMLKNTKVKFDIEDDDLCIANGNKDGGGGKFGRDDVNIYSKSDSEGEQACNVCYGCDCFSNELILDDENDPRGCLYFQASLKVLPNSCSIYPGVQLRVYSGNIRQTAVVEGVMSRNNVICPGESAPAVMRFCKQPEYIRPDRRVLLRASRETCAVGTVTQVFPYIER